MARTIVKKALSVFLMLGLIVGFASIDMQTASAGEEPFIGEITMFAGNFAPQDYLFCQGQLLSIQEYAALYSILGTTYGGDGKTNFALPDLRCRVPIGPGQASGLSLYTLGQTGGYENVSLTANEMPVHSHQLQAVDVAGELAAPSVTAYPAQVTTTASTPDRQEITINTRAYASEDPAQNTMFGPTLPAGASQAHENRQPYLVINFIIATQGIYPQRP
jgi:microcystin-dependent protein